MADYTRLSAGRSGFDSPCRGHIMSLEIWNHITKSVSVKPSKHLPKGVYILYPYYSHPIVLMEDKDGTD